MEPGQFSIAAGVELNLDNLQPDTRTQLNKIFFLQKIDQMAEITRGLSRPGIEVGQNFFEAEEKLRALRAEAKPFEDSLDVTNLKAMNEERGLPSTGTKAELLERLYYEVDYFYNDHLETAPAAN